MKKSDMTLQHKFVSYMILSTLLFMLSSYWLLQWSQSSFHSVVLPSEAVLMQNIAAEQIVKADSVQTPAIQAVPLPELKTNTATVSAEPAMTNIGTIASESIQAVKIEVVDRSQRQYLMILSLLMVCQFIGSIVWVRYMLVKPVHETVCNIDTLTMGNYELEPCLDGKHELDHLNHQLYVLSEQLRQNKVYRDSESSQRKSLIAGMSHDLKTPLTNIIGYAETLTMEPGIEPHQMGWIDIISRNAHLANRLIEDLLDLNRYDLTQYPVNKSLIDIESLIKECSLDFEDLLRQNNQQVTLSSFTNELCQHAEFCESAFNTDKILMVRLIKNVLSNFHQHAGTHATLNIRGTFGTEDLTLVFEDDGNGVASEAVPMLTNIFYVGDDSRNKKGSSGLGLYNCQQIVTLLGGRLSVESDSGKGFKMTVLLCREKTSEGL